MNKITRRKFIQSTAVGGAALMAARRGFSADQPLSAPGKASGAGAATASIEILLDEPIGTISPDIYGHFTEHIGGVIYDGIWVGENSKVPNIGGIRTALVEHMKRIKPSVVRWPGGCFADSYNWRDGIGPREKRPRRVNFWADSGFLQKAPDGPVKYDPNEFGTNEFMRFCRLIGAQPYLATNVRSNTPRDFDEWVEYCNAPASQTTMAQQRAANGDADPFRVRFWGIGNESWGCGGDFTPEEYATEFRRFTSWVPGFGVPLAFIGAGPNGGGRDGDVDWTRKFFAHLTERDRGMVNRLYGWALHYYCGTAGKGDAISFTVGDWYELLGKALRMESLIKEHWVAMGEMDSRHHVKLVVDEWGAWHHAGTEVAPTHLFGQTSTMRDALIAALTLDTFNRQADKVAMANVAQLINNLHSLFLAREDNFVATPNFYVFEMYAAHQQGKSLRTVFDVPGIEATEAKRALPGLAGSVSLHEKGLVLSVVNLHASEARPVEIRLRGGSIQSGTARELAAPDIHAHNSFDQPAAVVPRDVAVTAIGQSFNHVFPPASVTRMELELG